ncbi:hypothetical protein BDM02DRAFT_3130526 [Thelephora ganbajun]|uniref:Uncharacterized protein n=1 Tax=Thelephora ganbajun TaxID=370292 RepID=A0ACB6Z9F4_THEGA|nr:hypothetical protein BDM02DRAFT_3130526 [Thelephora ganbajun]
MPTFDIYSRDDVATTLLWDNGQAAPTMTVTINPGRTQISSKVAEHSNSLGPGVIGAIAVVSVLVVICVVTAAILHRSWCMNPRCRACLILRCGRRKPRQGRARDKRLSNLPTFTRRSSDPIVTGTSEKSGYSIPDCLPLDRHFRRGSEGASPLATAPRLQEIGSNKPRYFNTNSIVSNVALITTFYTDPAAVTSTLVSTSPAPAIESDQEHVERSAKGKNHPSSALNAPNFNTARSRGSQGSGMLSIITLPSFIANDRPRPYSTSVAVQIESPVRPHNHHRKRSSIFGQRFSGTDAVPPVSPVNDEDGSGKRSRPTSAVLQIFNSVLQRRGSTSSSVRSSSPSRRSLRRSQGRLNLSFGAEDEAAIEWRRLPPLHSVHDTSAIQIPDSHRASGSEDFLPERLPSYCEDESKLPGLLAAHIPLPPSPSTQASSVSPLTYAPPSPEEIPPLDGFTTVYSSHPLLLPSTPSTPVPFSYPPTPRSTDKFVDPHMTHPVDRIVSPTTSTFRHLSGDVDRNLSNLNTPTIPTLSAFPGSNDGSLPYGPNDDGAGWSAYRRSAISAYSQHSNVQELVLPPAPLLTVPPSPLPPISPRGPRPRPLPAPGQASRSGTLYRQTSPTGQ